MKRLHYGLTVLAVVLFVSFCITWQRGEAGERFIDNNDGTVTDRLLHVMWAKTDNQGDINWHQASQWVTYTFSETIETKYDNWRLPTIEELKTLYEWNPHYEGYETACGRTVKIVPEIHLTCGWVWAAETRSITASLFNFTRGYHYTGRQSEKRGHRALPVRNLEK